MSPWIADVLAWAGTLIVGLVGLQVLWLTGDLVRRQASARAQRERELELMALRVASARKRSVEEETRSQAWSGWRKFEIRRKTIEDQQDEMCSFYLAPHDGKSIAPYEPGQYLTFRLSIPGQSRPTVRCYSMSDSYKADHYRVTIKRRLPPPDKPDAPPGLASSYFLDGLKERDILDVQAPAGHFFLDMGQETPVVLIGGGVGVTPVLAMLNAVAESGSHRETWFFYGLRNSRDHIMKTHLENIAREHPNIRLHVCYSRPADDDKPDIDYHHGERVTIDLLNRVLPSNNYDFYMCGPPAMMTTLPDALTAWGVPEARIHLETFGPSSRKKKAKTVPTGETGSGPEIVFRRSGQTLRWDPAAADSLWELADAHEIKIDAGCWEGNCGSCLTAVLAGEVEYLKTPGYECEAGTCLTCCCVPKGRVELDA